MTTDAEIEKTISAKGLVAPRITPEIIQNWIAGEYFATADQMYPGAPILPGMHVYTVCTLVLINGFIVTGHSAPASVDNFDKDLGAVLARQNAVNKIWELLGFQLKSELKKVRLLPEQPEDSLTIEFLESLAQTVRTKLEYGRTIGSIQLGAYAPTDEAYVSFRVAIYPNYLFFLEDSEAKNILTLGERIPRLDSSLGWLLDIIATKTEAYFQAKGATIYWRITPEVTRPTLDGEKVPVLYMRLLLTDLPPSRRFTNDD
jgi:hypothetical protein